jgi:hypothetical protein
MLDGPIYPLKIGLAYRGAGDEDQIPTGGDAALAKPGCLPQEPLGPVAGHRFAHPFANGEAETAVSPIVGQGAQHQQRVNPGTPLAPYPLEVLAFGQTVRFPHLA